jgi:hypothetical protein
VQGARSARVRRAVRGARSAAPRAVGAGVRWGAGMQPGAVGADGARQPWLDKGVAMLSSDFCSASMPSFASVAAAMANRIPATA